jgi:hypothetical protein
VKETGCRQREVSHWSNCVARDFGALVGLASPCPGTVIILYACPHETLSASLLLWCLGAKDRRRTGTLWSRKGAGTYRWRPWCREFVASRATGVVRRQVCSKLEVTVLQCGQCIVGWWRSDRFEARESFSDVLFRHMLVCQP